MGRILALFEQGFQEEASDVLRFFQSALPDKDRIPVVELQMVERIRPFIDAEHALQLLDSARDLKAPTHQVYWIRARLPLAVAMGDWVEVESLIEKSHELAISTCAPTIVSMANWAIAVREGSSDGARRFLSEVDEPYTAVRLAVDFFSMAPGSYDDDFRASTELVLKEMGALASLAQLAADSDL